MKVGLSLAMGDILWTWFRAVEDKCDSPKGHVRVLFVTNMRSASSRISLVQLQIHAIHLSKALIR